MATVALQLAVRADGHVYAVLLTAGAPPGDADMHDEVRLPSDSVRLEILGVPATRLQAGAMKLKSGPAVERAGRRCLRAAGQRQDRRRRHQARLTQALPGDGRR